ncbi:MAG: DUF1800 domain-containing protein [Nitrospira sp.]
MTETMGGATAMGSTGGSSSAVASAAVASGHPISPNIASSSVVTPPAGSGNRGVERLLNQMPGLLRVVSPPTPPEPVAPPAPPLGPPPSGLPVAPANWFGYHVLNRITFGGTPSQLNLVSHMNAVQVREWGTRYLKEQLGLDPGQPWPSDLHSTNPLPSAIPIVDTDTDLLLISAKGTWKPDTPEPTVLKPELNQIQDADLIRKLHSRRQLLEKMVYFWDNHFNTDYRSHFRGQYEIYENDAFRMRAFARFEELLIVSGKSSAMMVYLNTDVNKKENPNENYAREVFELHTLGTDEQGRPNGYTQADIVEAAKTFTGWTTPEGVAPGFRFLPQRHSPGSKTVLGQTISFDGTGPGEGERVLRIAAAHPSTARHLSRKLCEYFVSETPSASLVTEVASVFSDSGGDIRKVLIAIFTSPDFNDVANYRGLVKTPLEFMVGLYRNLGVWSSRDPIRRRLTTAGQGLYEMPPPTGYKEKSDHWLNTHVLFHEVATAYETTIPGFGSTVRFGSDTSGGLTRLWLKELGLRTEEEVLGFLLNLTTDRVASSTEYQVYLSTLRSGGVLNLDSAGSELPLDRTLATILANPRYLYQ